MIDQTWKRPYTTTTVAPVKEHCPEIFKPNREAEPKFSLLFVLYTQADEERQSETL